MDRALSGENMNYALYLAEEFLENTKNPYEAGDVAYDDRPEHCRNGDPDFPTPLVDRGTIACIKGHGKN